MKIVIQIVLCIQCLSVIRINSNPLIGEGVEQVNKNDFPFLVSIGHAPGKRAEDHFCGGTLISSKLILTARHCFENLDDNTLINPLATLKVTVGSYDSTSGRKCDIRSYKTYDRWARGKNIRAPNLGHDIAIAELFDDAHRIEPVTISELTDEELDGKLVVTAGWGATNDDDDPKYLHKATLYTISKEDCKKIFKQINESPDLHKNRLCTTNTIPVHFGHGDSGGPLLVIEKERYELVGVNAHLCPSNINHANTINAHHSVTYYRKFIESVMKEASYSPGDKVGSSSGSSRKSSCWPW